MKGGEKVKEVRARRPTYEQKKRIAKKRYNPTNWNVISDSGVRMEIIHKTLKTRKVITI